MPKRRFASHEPALFWQFNWLSPGKRPMMLPGAVTFHALTAIWRLPSLFPEEDKMGMIAFYAGLFIGVLVGLLLSSLLAFSLAGSPRGSQPNQAEGSSQCRTPRKE